MPAPTPRGSSRGTRAFESLEPRNLLAANPIITEFMASNSDTLRDGNDNSSDWIELYNAGDDPVDLSGYRLTDDPSNLSRWTFPRVTLQPDSYLVVFASGQETADFRDSQGNLHTNFKLSRGGEYLALVDPTGTVLSQYGSGTLGYPAQVTDVSFGISQARTFLTRVISRTVPTGVYKPNGLKRLRITPPTRHYDHSGKAYYLGTTYMCLNNRLFILSPHHNALTVLKSAA